MRRFFFDDKGQGIVEYTLLIGLVAIIVWAVIANTGIAQTVKGIWGDVDGQMPDGTSPRASSSGGGSSASGGSGGGSGGSGTSGRRNDGNANGQHSSVTNQPAQREGVGAQNSGENGGALQEPAFSVERTLNGVSNISESQWNNLSMGLGLALFVLIASVIPMIVWLRIKSVEKSEISFQGLQADQIVAKIKEAA